MNRKRTSLLRSSLSLTAALSLVLGAASVAAAASPVPNVGGELAQTGHTIVVTSHGNVPATVTMASETVQLSETTFRLKPGESREVTYTGEPKGEVSATFVTQALNVKGDTGTTKLVLGLDPKPRPEPFPTTALLLV